MRAGTLVSSITLAGLAVTWVFIALGPAPGGDSAVAVLVADRLEDMELRMEALSRDLSETRRIAASRPADAGFALSEAGPPAEDLGEEDDAAEREDDELYRADANLAQRVESMDIRLRALERDPISRGYAFLDSSSADLRRRGLRTLAELAKNDPQARASIRELATDPDPGVRATAIDALSDIGDKESIALFLDALADDNANVREEAVDAIADTKSAEYASSVAGMVTDPNDDVRERAVQVLGELKYEGGVETIVQALQDEDGGVQSAAIWALGEVGAAEAAPVLRQMYDGDPGGNRWRVVDALKRLGDTAPFETEVARLRQAATEGQGDARHNALRELARHARRESAEVFQQALEDPDERIRGVARWALGRGGRGR